METEALALAHEVDFSMWGLFARATLTVKLVMIMLILASFWSWAIIVQKLMQYRRARAEAEAFDQAFWSGEPLDGLFDTIGAAPDGPSEKVFAAGMTEWRRSHREDGGLIPGATARIDRSMDVAISKEADNLQKGLTVLAAAGAAAVAGIGAAAIKAASEMEQISREARDARVDAQTYQALTGAVEALGGEAENVRAGLAELKLRAQEALEDPESGRAQAFERYGISVRDANGE